MIKKLTLLLFFFLTTSCAEKIIKEPENLISKDEMAKIYYDLAIVTATKNTNNEVLKKNNVEPMDYLYTKYGIDSLRFVESDLYYASKPTVYKEIYQNVENKLKLAIESMQDIKKGNKKKDSLNSVKNPKDLDSLSAIIKSKNLDSIAAN